jgi:hypothetical protein
MAAALGQPTPGGRAEGRLPGQDSLF